MEGVTKLNIKELKSKYFEHISSIFKDFKINLRGKELLRRLIFSNILIALVAVIIMGISSIYISKSITDDNVTNLHNAALIQTKDRSDNYIKDLFRITQLLNSNTESLIGFKMWKAEDKKTPEFREWLSAFNLYIKSYNDFVRSVWIYNNNIIVGTDTGISAPNDFIYWNTLSSAVNEASKNYQYMPYITKPFLMDIHPYAAPEYETFFSLVMPINTNDKSFSHGSIIININYNMFSRNLSAIDSSSGSSIFIYDSKNNIVFAKSKTDLSDNELLNKETIEKINSDSETPYKGNVNISGKKYSVYSTPSSVSENWHYVILNDRTPFAKKLNSVLKLFGVIVFWMLIFEAVMIIFISAYIYTPLQNIITNLNLPQESSSNNEIKVINNYISSLQTENKKIQRQLRDRQNSILENIPKLTHAVFYDLIHDNYASAAEWKKALNSINASFSETHCLMIVFAIDLYDEVLNSRTTSELKTLHNNVLLILKDKIMCSYKCIGTHIKNDKYCFVLNIPSLPDLTHFDGIFMQLNNCLQEKLNITVSAGIGNSTDNYSELGKQYAYICNALNEKFFTGNMSVLTLHNTPSFSGKNLSSQKETISKIINAILSNDSLKAKSAFNELFNSINGAAEFKFRINSLIASAEQLFSDSACSYDFSAIKSRLDLLYMYSDISHTENYMANILSELCSCYRKNDITDTADQIITYINHNYNTDLSLTALSETFNLSAPYLSKIFKARHNIGVTEYITQVRIENAKEMLKNTHLPIKTVGEKSGFTTYSSFSRVFKKECGMSAKDYRNQFYSG